VPENAVTEFIMNVASWEVTSYFSTPLVTLKILLKDGDSYTVSDDRFQGLPLARFPNIQTSLISLVAIKAQQHASWKKIYSPPLKNV